MTIKEACEEFLLYLGSVKGMSQNTVTAYKNDLGQLCLMQNIGLERQIETVTTEDLRLCVGNMSLMHRKNTSINRFISSFRSLFAYPVGPVNQFLTGTLGIWSSGVVDGEIVKQGFNFFRMPNASRLIVSFIQWWMWCGHTLIMLMAGITSISPSLYEAAIVDGANNRQQTFYITLPLLRPMMLYILVTSMIGGMQLFEIPFLLTGMHGEPDFKIRTMSVYLYNMGFQQDLKQVLLLLQRLLVLVKQ